MYLYASKVASRLLVFLLVRRLVLVIPRSEAAGCERTVRSVAWNFQTAAHLCEPLFKFPMPESSDSGPGLRWIALLRLQLVNPSTLRNAYKSEHEPER